MEANPERSYLSSLLLILHEMHHRSRNDHLQRLSLCEIDGLPSDAEEHLRYVFTRLKPRLSDGFLNHCTDLVQGRSGRYVNLKRHSNEELLLFPLLLCSR
jgi:hypothetical protein